MLLIDSIVQRVRPVLFSVALDRSGVGRYRWVRGDLRKATRMIGTLVRVKGQTESCENSHGFPFRWGSVGMNALFQNVSYSILVGAGRFERPTPCAQGRCATRLRYAPTSAP